MNKLFAGTLAVVLVLVMSMSLVTADVATGTVGTSAGPGDKDPKICVKDRLVIVDGINNCDYRTGMYAFAGELIMFEITIRDPNGALDIGFPKVRVDGGAEVLCNEIEPIDYCNGLEEFDCETDKSYECILTVEPSWYGDSQVKMTVYNSAFQPTDGTHKEHWFFNPAIRLDTSTSDGQAIHFEEGGPGDTVHSENNIIVKNIAEGGVNLWMFLAGTDMYDPDGASKCPWTNVLEIENMEFRSWSGTIQNPDFDDWVPMSRYDQNDGCDWACYGHPFKTCYGAKPVPFWSPMGNLLTNQGKLEVEFKLTYPVPCVGSFSQGTIYIFGKAV